MIGHNRRISVENGLKLLGERNSGTNFLENTLRDHYDLALFRTTPPLTPDIAPVAPAGHVPRGDLGMAAREALVDHMHHVQMAENGGWKHAAPDARFHDVFLAAHRPAVVILLRHPANWLRSMHRNPFHAIVHVPRDFSTFLRQPWLTQSREGLGQRQFPTLADMMVAKVGMYADLLRRYENSTLLRYEDAVRDPVATLSAIGLTPRAPYSNDGPSRDARPFMDRSFWGRLRARTTDYKANAAASGYDTLAPNDRAFLLERLADSPLLALYPA